MFSALIKDPIFWIVAVCLVVIFAVRLYMFLKRHDRKPIDLVKHGFDL